MKLVPLKQWICDSCRELIENPQDGWFEWYTEGSTSLDTGFRIVHHRQSCMYNDHKLNRQNRSPNDLHLTHVVGPDGLGALLNMMEHIKFEDIREFIKVLRRLHLPHYEEARQYWDQARSDGLLDGNEYQQNSLLAIIREYGAS